MDMIQNFISDYYIWIIVICLFLIFTLIGYIADKKVKEEKDDKPKKTKNTKKEAEIKDEEIIDNDEIVDEKPKTLDELIQQSNEKSKIDSIKPKDENKDIKEDKTEKVVIEDKEKTADKKEETKIIDSNDWAPALESENDSIITGENNNKEDSK